MSRPPSGPTGPRPPGVTAALALLTAANELGLSEAAIAEALAGTTWGSAQELLAREFEGAYRSYYPKCRMARIDEAAVAAVFDALAEILDDPRRALREGTWTGGRSDG